MSGRRRLSPVPCRRALTICCHSVASASRAPEEDRQIVRQQETRGCLVQANRALWYSWGSGVLALWPASACLSCHWCPSQMCISFALETDLWKRLAPCPPRRLKTLTFFVDGAVRGLDRKSVPGHGQETSQDRHGCRNATYTRF